MADNKFRIAIHGLVPGERYRIVSNDSRIVSAPDATGATVDLQRRLLFGPAHVLPGEGFIVSFHETSDRGTVLLLTRCAVVPSPRTDLGYLAWIKAVSDDLGDSKASNGL